jgi:hypothetical protein
MSGDGAPVVEMPTNGVDGRVALATAVHAAPGVYAALVGSGMSSAAGIPTGWQVVQDLIRKVALAEGVDPSDVENRPEEWWAAQGRPEPRYDTLLPGLATTDAARQALLRKYFESLTDGTQVQPTAGHHALAALAATGRVRVILTTNFDRLIERALDQAGVAPQVIASSGAIAGMTPMVHAPTTVIKLHGDYLSLGLRNTPDELTSYPEEIKTLLARVFDEYGLLVVGWSAEYDTALVEALESAPSRRYPTFWAMFDGDLKEPARRLIAQRQACVIDTAGADEFLEDLVQKVTRLDQVAQRRNRPTPLRTYFLMPESSSAPQGWGVLPLLQLRAAAIVGPASPDTCGLIRAESREALLTALRVAALTSRLRNMAGYPAAPAIGEPPTPGTTVNAPFLTDWVPSPGGYQTYDYCTYRIGGDATVGISALVTVRLPGFSGPVGGGSVVFTADVAISLERTIRMAEAAMILRDGLVLVTATLPGMLADVMPGDASTNHAEVHFLAATQHGSPGTQGNRQNDVLQRVDLSPLGTPTRDIGPSMGFAARLPGPLTEREAADLVCEALEQLAYAVGYLDPRLGIRQLRQEMGVPEAATASPSAGSR